MVSAVFGRMLDSNRLFGGSLFFPSSFSHWKIPMMEELLFRKRARHNYARHQDPLEAGSATMDAVSSAL